MKDIVSSLRVTLGLQRSSGNASNGSDPNSADAGASNRASASGTSADLYECPSCDTVLIEPATEECSQCPSGTLTKV